jgi:DNA-binding transcriptional ArsR family regulator
VRVQLACIFKYLYILTMSQSELPVVKAELFRALAHPARIRILELLATGERTVQDIQGALALTQPVASQQLAVLRARLLVSSRRKGTASYYALRSPLVGDLLAVARRFLNQRFTDNQSILRELRREARR